MSVPRVSIIIPAYNYESYVGKALASALGQTHSKLEVIAVDDGSTDGTAEVLAEFGERIVLITQQNAGLAAARNAGVAKATGDYLFFLDADDLLVPEAIEKMVARIHQGERGAPCAMVACAYANVDDAGQRLNNEPPVPNPDREVTLRELILKNRFSPAVLIRTEVLREIGGFDTDFGRAEMGSEDRDLWIRAAMHGPVFMMAERLVLKRQHDTNMSSNPERQTASMRRTLSKSRRAGAVSRWNLLFWARVYAVYHYQAALMYRDAGRKWRATGELGLSFVRCPLPCPHRPAGLQPFFRTRSLLVTMRSLFAR